MPTTDWLLASANGVVDKTFWGTAFVSDKLDERSSIDFSATESWFDSGFDGRGDGALGYSATLAYYRHIVSGLTGTAAVGLDGIVQDNLPDIMSASALAGLRYTF